MADFGISAFWCSELKGFGVFVQSSGTRTYFVDYRNEQNKRRRMTLGRLGIITAEEARKLAISTLGQALNEASAHDEAPQVVNGAWLIALSGCRLGEIINLKWDEVDDAGSCLRLDDSKESAAPGISRRKSLPMRRQPRFGTRGVPGVRRPS